ncbi:serine hydrolase domain-containing protein [Actinoplanes regularis]|uniref:serine hydrolase domain-containing protein n=1 Tax=Actinoplanes regularis TaxID=52697 RepID=UPI0024A38704|nr:serine hydrolase domain-containing protein [Actinoplanes regularis]GLW30542.1 serine hydrolase [Actinoplanes regularis]
MDLQARLDEAAKRHGVPGAVIAVSAGGELFEAATGVVNRNTGVEATPDSVFQIGSVTKTWTASLVLQLVAEGRVELDAPVRRYLPEFGVIDRAASETVTVRQLLSHTGGFDGDLFEDTGRGDDAVGKLVAWMRTNARQVHPPGELHSYCNAGYCVLGAMIARLRGGTWESVLRERMIEPLGVTQMALYGEEAAMFRAAVGHLGDGWKVAPLSQLPRANAPAGSTPAAAPRELVRLGRMFLADGLAEDGTRVLPSGTFAAMREPQIATPVLSGRSNHHWGLGFMLFTWDGTDVVGHDGGTPGQTTYWRIVPGRDVVIALSVNGGAADALFDDVFPAVLAETTGLRMPPGAVPPVEPIDAPAVTGTFESPVERYEVTGIDGGLTITTIPRGAAIRFGEQPASARFVPLGGDRFVSVEPAGGAHTVVAFLRNGQYLYNGRAIPRI